MKKGYLEHELGVGAWVDLGALDGEDLRGNDGQNLNVDAVELIEAAPCSRLGVGGWMGGCVRSNMDW